MPNLNDSPHGKIPKLTISLKGVHDQLSKSNTSKSQGPDGIPPWFLNRYASHLTPIIHDIFQSSVDSGQVPKPWNEANITAIFKKGNRAETSNYRPITLTPVISKLLEHIIHSHIMKHLEQHHILTNHQHGFRAKRSTETQLIQIVHDKSKYLDEKKSVDMAILDLTKTFDKVPYKRLIHKLKYSRPNIVMDRKLPCRKNSTGCNTWISIHTNSSHLSGTTGNRTGAPTFLTLHK